jgi:adenylate/nucleoside-diphosphate kinase
VIYREEEEQKPEKVADEVEELTSEEENIKAYLQDGEPLAPEILDKIIKPWWTEEPYRSRGFVLEGFPSTEDETVYLIENQLIPDIVIQLNAESGDLLKRILPKRMEQWAKKIQTRKDKRMKNKAKKDRDKVGNIILKLTLLIMISFLEKSDEGTSS